MGACFDTLTIESKKILGIRKSNNMPIFDSGLTDKYIKAEFNAYIEECDYDSGHSYTGRLNMCSGLKFDDKIFSCSDVAYEYLCENTTKAQHALAVRIKDGGHYSVLIGGWCSS